MFPLGFKRLKEIYMAWNPKKYVKAVSSWSITFLDTFKQSNEKLYAL
jgi:hypothetical protein